MLALLVGFSSQLFPGRDREGEMKCRALTRLTLHPNPPAMSYNGQAAKRQANTQTAGPAIAVQPRELVKNVILLSRGDTRAVILDPKVNHVAFFAGAGLDPAAGRAELAGIFHKVDEYAAGHILIHPNRGQLHWKIGDEHLVTSTSHRCDIANRALNQAPSYQPPSDQQPADQIPAC